MNDAKEWSSRLTLSALRASLIHYHCAHSCSLCPAQRMAAIRSTGCLKGSQDAGQRVLSGIDICAIEQRLLRWLLGRVG